MAELMHAEDSQRNGGANARMPSDHSAGQARIHQREALAQAEPHAGAAVFDAGINDAIAESPSAQRKDTLPPSSSRRSRADGAQAHSNPGLAI